MSVEVKNVSKYYGKQAAVKNLAFSLAKGEILGFLGPNGAGKTTTMKMISGYLAPSEGTIHLDNFNIHEHSLIIRKKIGYLPEHNPLYLDMYVKEFLLTMCRIHGIPSSHRNKRVGEVIDMTGLNKEQHKRINQLSKGYRQRVGLGQAILHDPDVLILDEPTTGLDPNQIIDIRNLIKELGTNKSIIFSSHILSEVEAIADRIIIINKGEMVANEVVKDIHNSLQEETIVTVEFEKEGYDFSFVLDQDGVISVNQLTPCIFEVKTRSSTDIRSFLFHDCVRQQNVILSLQQEMYTLEDTFRNLTN